ncbi:substrate-binding domain-containing protein [Lachnoclostridium sp. An181]|uniref:substrate-binding domain-containing protein n=1 Tax=Lachnoclostridium sp. An181 TaxID=1965575 RepID=UPI000B37F146|nr:substrate-binding domain-containing protein [Lachnoclostridium sp. An181]OUP49127.1 hypothetical protein B5F18_09365 [Lachnoclostridium sp. An181]
MKQSRKRLILLVLSLVAMTCGLGCTDRKNERKEVAMITKSTNSSFFKSMYAGAKSAAAEFNVELQYEGPQHEEDFEMQNVMIKNAIDREVDAIIISAIDYNQSVELLDKAADSGIKVVVVDSDVNSDKVSQRIGTDNYAAGQQAAEILLKKGEGNLRIAVVNFDENTENGQEREKGFLDTIIKEPGAIIEKRIKVPSDRVETKERTIEMLKENPNIDAIVTFNEWTTLGVGDAVKEIGQQTDIAVVGFDNHIAAIEMLEAGTIDALIVQNPFAMGYLGVKSAWELSTGNRGASEKKVTETVTVTEENMFDSKCQKLLFPFE